MNVVVGRLAFCEVRIQTRDSHGVVKGHRVFQAAGIDAAGLSQLSQAVAASQIAVVEHASQRHWRGFDRAQPVAAQEVVITHQPGLHGLPAGRRSEEALHEVVIRIRFVGEALAAGRDGDQTRFGAFDQMGEMGKPRCFALRCLVHFLRHQRHGRERRCLGQVLIHHTPG